MQDDPLNYAPPTVTHRVKKNEDVRLTYDPPTIEFMVVDPLLPYNPYFIDPEHDNLFVSFADVYTKRHQNIFVSINTKDMATTDEVFVVGTCNGVLYYSDVYPLTKDDLDRGFKAIPFKTNILLSCLSQTMTFWYQCQNVSVNFARRSYSAAVRVGPRRPEIEDRRIFSPPRPRLQRAGGKAEIIIPGTHIQKGDELEIEYYSGGSSVPQQIKPIIIPADGDYTHDISSWMKDGKQHAWFMYTFNQGDDPIRHFSEVLFRTNW